MQSRDAPPIHPPTVSAEVQAAALNAWRVGVIVDVARAEVTDSAPLGALVKGERVCAHVERVDAILAGAAALVRELHRELGLVDDHVSGRS